MSALIAYMYYLVHSGSVIVLSIMQISVLGRVGLLLLVFLVFLGYLALLPCTGSVVSLHGSTFMECLVNKASA